MPSFAVDRTSAKSARATLAAIRLDRQNTQADAARQATILNQLTRQFGAADVRVQTARTSLAAAQSRLASVRAQERAALDRVSQTVAALLSADPAADFRALETTAPIALLPVRLETRVHTVAGARPELWLRLYPDEILADSHDPLLTEAEQQLGRVYWTNGWALAAEPEAWRALVQAIPAPRAAWIVRAMTPTNLDTRPAGQPVFPPQPARPAGPTRGAEAQLLPDRWVVSCFRTGVIVHRTVSRAVHPGLALALAADADPTDMVDVSGDGLSLEPALAWTVLFDRAEAVGMAVRIPLDATDLVQGFDRIVVVGVKPSLDADDGATQLARLFEAHHYTRGVAFIPQGTPTNNMPGAPAGFPAPDPDGQASFRVERAAPALDPTVDGARFFRALGLPPDLARNVANAGMTADASARAMNEALWPATLGYFLDQMMAPVFDAELISAAKRHLVEQVRGRGPYPAFRIGETPYGLLPSTSLARWIARTGASRFDVGLPEALRRLLPFWRAQIAAVPRVGRTADPDADLLAVFGLDASTREVRVRSVQGGELQVNLHLLHGLDWTRFSQAHQRIARAVLTQLGHPEWDPRVAWMVFADDAPLFRFPLVAELPDEQGGLAFNFIQWIRTATIDDLRREALPQGIARPMLLLYRLLRHAMLLAYAGASMDVLVQHNLATVADRREAELVGIVLSSAQRPTLWQRLARPVPGVTGAKTLGDFLPETAGKGAPLGMPDGHARVMRALQQLEGLSTAELTRLTGETLDLCSHRLDAWVTSLAMARLSEIRAAHPTGVHVGVFGWIDGLRLVPAPRRIVLPDGRTAIAPTHSGGAIQAPSMRHAATAAVLRNAFLSRTDGTRYALTLSSDRVRAVLDVLDAVREGQSLGAVLGARFERGLHDRFPAGALQRYVAPLRALFPLAAGDATGAGRSVVHGVRLRDAWRADRLPFGQGGLPTAGPDRQALEAELGRLDDALDGVADLLMAESVYQLVGGNTDAATASLDALARGTRPPDPEVARTPRGGTSLTHRVIVGLSPDGPPLAPSWSTAASPRALAEPVLDTWVGSLLGDPAAVRCRVRAQPKGGAAAAEQVVTLATLGLRPLDVLALARDLPSRPTPEIDQRVVRAAFGEPAPNTETSVLYDRAPDWDINVVRTFPDVLALARAASAVVQSARPLGPADLRPPGATAEAMDSRIAAEAMTRARAAEIALGNVRTRLARAADAVRHEVPPGASLSELLAALAAAALFGCSAYPRPGAGRDALLAQATTALADMERRATAAGAAHPPTGAGLEAVAVAAAEIACAVFGRDFVLLPRFTPATDAVDRALADPGLLSGDTRAPMRWLQQVTAVRPRLGAWRRLRLYAKALGGSTLEPAVAQLPQVDGARWAALPFRTPADRPPSGHLSLVVHRVVATAPGAPWTGLVLDEWTEVIPADTVDTTLAFHYDNPRAEAPQAILIVVPPTDAPQWELDTVVDALNETLDLAAVRAVDGELLGALGQLLPALYLAANVSGDTVSTSFADALATDARPIVPGK